MIWLIIIGVIGVIGFIAFRLSSSLNKDLEDLDGITLDEKFKIIVNMLNDAAYNGTGLITRFDKSDFNIYEQGSNQIIQFHYGYGHLTILWKYKYFQKEVVHQRRFKSVRNLSVFEQQKIAEQMIKEMSIIVEKHKLNVFGGSL